MNSDAMHPYFRYLAMLAAGQPRLRPPPGGQLLTASPGQLAELMPFTHPISGYRDRSFEFRELVLRFMGQEATAGTAATSAAAQNGSHAADSQAYLTHAPGEQPQQPLHNLHSHSHPHRHHPQPHPNDHPSHHQHHHHPQGDLGPPPHSYMEVLYPFSSRPWLWSQYYLGPGRPNLGLAPGPLLEDLDTFAADVAARHVGPLEPRGAMLVTAALERFTLHVHGHADVDEGHVADGEEGRAVGSRRLPPLLLPTDMRLSGQVTWVGRSTMEVLLQLTAVGPHTEGDGGPHGAPMQRKHHLVHQDHRPRGQDRPVVCLRPGQLVASADFVMALRDSSLRRAVPVPHLPPPPAPGTPEPGAAAGGELAEAHNGVAREAAAEEGVQGLKDAGEHAAGAQSAGAGGEGLDQAALERQLFRRGREHNRQRQLRRERDAGAPSPSEVAALAAALPPPPPAWLNSLSTTHPTTTTTTTATAHAAHTTTTCSSPQPPLAASALALAPGCAKAAAAAAGVVPMRATAVERCVLATWSDRNTSGTVFGGHLLRLAAEHAEHVARRHAGVPCELLMLEECAILAPGRVGDVLRLQGHVAWAEAGGRALRVAVMVQVGRPGGQGEGLQALGESQAESVTALTLSAVFAVPEGAGQEGRRSGMLSGVEPVGAEEVREVVHALRTHVGVMAAVAGEEEGDGKGDGEEGRGAEGGKHGECREVAAA